MDPTSQLLAQLKDVHSPQSIGSWPPAIGWILLSIIAVVCLTALLWFTFRWYKNNAWRRAALKEFKRLKPVYQQAPSPQGLATINALLKRCTASLQHDNSLLATHGKIWADILRKPEGLLQKQDIELLCYSHYQAECLNLDENALVRIEKWIKRIKA